MIGLALMAAAAHAPVILAATDETRWHLFVRSSLQRPAVTPATRLRQLEGVVRGLDAERAQRLAGPAGL